MKSPQEWGSCSLKVGHGDISPFVFISLPSASLVPNCNLLKVGSRSSDPEPLGNSQGWLTVCGNLAKLARRRHLGQAGKQSMPCCGSTGPCNSYYLCSPSRLQEAETGEGGLPPCPAQPLSFSPSPSLQPASPLCSDRRARPSPCEPSLAAMPLPHAPLDPQRPLHHASAPCPASRPTCAEPMASCQGLGLPAEAETEISPLGRFSSAQRAWGLCLALRSSPRASSR